MKIIYSILFLFLTAASFSAEGGICIPCDACWIQSVGGPVLEPGSVGDMVSRGISEGQKSTISIRMLLSLGGLLPLIHICIYCSSWHRPGTWQKLHQGLLNVTCGEKKNVLHGSILCQ